MTDYDFSTGTSGTMKIRDTASTVEFWLNSNNSTTWTANLPWSGTVNGSGVGGSYYYHPNSSWNRIGVWGVSTSQNVTFAIGSTGTSGFGGPSSHTVFINRATVPPAPNPVILWNITSTSMHAGFTNTGDGGSPVLEWEIAYGTDPNGPNLTAFGSGVDIYGLTPGTTYYFWARGRNAVGWSAYSTRSQETTLKVPAAPTHPQLTDVTQTSVTVSWTANGDGGSPITGFDVGYRPRGSDEFIPASPSVIIPNVVSPYIVTGLSPGLTYFFFVRAKNIVGNGPWTFAAPETLIAGARVHYEGTYRRAVPYVKSAGVWKLARPWLKASGTWTETT